ncbi:MAG: Mu transposase C-terminal domain-containing protein [Treponema sp.]|jgi:transposase InsO family protein|nr:Mu transposase C-terminal domain-containing protein [Treponema sp.]
MTDKWLTANEISELLAITKRPLNIRAKREGWSYRSYTTRGGKERRYHLATLPEDVQKAYAASIGITLDELTSRLCPAVKPAAPDPSVKPLEKHTTAERDTATLREKLILAWKDSGRTQADFAAAYSAGLILPDIRTRLGEELSDSTLSRWVRQYEKAGTAGLAPRYEHNRGGHGAAFDPHTKALIRFYYLKVNKYSLRKVQRMLEEKENIHAEYSMLCRYVRYEIGKGTKDYFLRGEKYFHDHNNPYIERDYTRYHSMQVVVADHKTFDFISRVKRVDGWHIVRLSLTCITDMRSRKILGWHIDEVPSTLTIIRAVKMMVEQYGCPEAFLVDNGKDFSSYWFAGNAWNEQHRKFGKKDKQAVSCVTDDLGSIVQFCIPYRGQSKPIERFFGFVSAEHDKSFDGYTGSNTSDRIDALKLYWGNFNGGQKIPVEELSTKEEVRTIFARFVEWFNSGRRHGGQGMNNNTPDTVFNENRKERRDMPEEYQKYVWTRRKILKVERNGVRFEGEWYVNKDLLLLNGRQVELRVSIDDIGAGYIFDPETGSYICDADCGGLKDSGIKEENNRKVNLLRKGLRKNIEEIKKEMDELRKDRKTQLEELREQESRQVTLKVVGGEDLVVNSPAGMTLVKTEVKPAKQKIKKFFDPD